MAARESPFAFGVHDKTANAIVNMAKQHVTPTWLVKDRRATTGCTNAHVADIVAAALGSTRLDNDAAWATIWALPLQRMARTAVYNRKAEDATALAAVELALATSGLGIARPREYKTPTVPAAIARRRFYGAQALPGANGPRRPVAPAVWPPSMVCIA